jgi:ketosteroid isomerase-like protein
LSAADVNELDKLHELNRNYVRSVQESDVRWFDANLAPDFMNSSPDGSLVDRAAFLRQIAPPCAVSGLREEDVRIQVLGDVAIVYARTTYGKPDGRPGEGRYTDVCQLRQGRWLCVSANVSRG